MDLANTVPIFSIGDSGWVRYAKPEKWRNLYIFILNHRRWIHIRNLSKSGLFSVKRNLISNLLSISSYK